MLKNSGAFVACLADGLALREQATRRSGLSDRLVDGLSEGTGAILASNRTLFIQALVEAAVPDALVAELGVPPLEGDRRWRTGLVLVLERLSKRWDEVAGHHGSGAPPTERVDVATLGVARVLAVDLAVRCAFVRAALRCAAPSSEALDALAAGRAFAHRLKVELARLGRNRTTFGLELSANEGGAHLAKSTFDAWLDGEALPSARSLEVIVETLAAAAPLSAAERAPCGTARLEAELRLARLWDHLFRMLGKARGEAFAKRWANAWLSMVEFLAAPLAGATGIQPKALWASSITGAGGKLGRGLVLPALATTLSGFDQRTILAAVEGEWSPVVHELVANLATPVVELKAELAARGMDAALGEPVRELMLLPPVVGLQPEQSAAVRSVFEDPLRPDVLDERADAAQLRGDVGEAIDSLERLLTARPDDVAARFRLGCAYAGVGALDRALYHLERVLLEDPRHFTSAVARGIAYINAEKPMEGVRAIEAALRDLGPRSDTERAHALTNLGAGLLAAKEPSRAEEVLREATELTPRNAQAWENLARACMACGDRKGARLPARRAAELGKGDALAELDRS